MTNSAVTLYRQKALAANAQRDLAEREYFRLIGDISKLLQTLDLERTHRAMFRAVLQDARKRLKGDV